MPPDSSKPEAFNPTRATNVNAIGTPVELVLVFQQDWFEPQEGSTAVTVTSRPCGAVALPWPLVEKLEAVIATQKAQRTAMMGAAQASGNAH